MPVSVDHLIERDGPSCGWCGRELWRRDLTLEHVVPRSRGGHMTEENALVACRRCNKRRGSKPVDAYVREPVIEVGKLVVDLQKRSVTMAGSSVHLTPHQFDLLRVLALNAGKLLTHRQLLQEVWGPGYADAANLLQVNVSQLRRKIEPDRGHPRYLLTETGAGYRLVEPV